MGAAPARTIGLRLDGDWLADPGAGGRPSPTERQRAIVARAVLAERLGFDSVWLGEHPSGDHAPPASTVVLAAIAARTARLRLGASVMLRAGLDPVRVAEDYATLDGISGGRVELLAGHGRLAKGAEAAGEPGDEDHERFGENLALLRRLWTETELTWSGRFRTPLERVTVEPRVVQRPHPPLWIGAGGLPGSVDLAGELGLPLMLPGAPAPATRLAPLVGRYRERAARAGRPARVGACCPIQLGPVGRSTPKRWKPPDPTGTGYSDRTWRQSGAGGARAPLAPGERSQPGGVLALCGSPAEIAEGILALREALDLDVELLEFDLGGLPETPFDETLARFAAELLPHLR